MKILVLLVGWVVCHLQLVGSQECTRESLEDFPTLAGLVSRSLAATTEASSLPTINIRNIQIVCQAVDTTANNFRGVSVVVQYSCMNGNTTCPAGGLGGLILSQMELSCENSLWSHEVTSTKRDNIITPPPQADLNTPLRTDCAFCFNAIRETSTEQPNHCIPCHSACDVPGLGMCSSAVSTGCCNVIETGQCRVRCSPNSVPDLDHVCRVNCTSFIPALYQSFSIDTRGCTYEGCTATYTCNSGLRVIDTNIVQTSYQVTCIKRNNMLAEWDGEGQLGPTRTCSQQCDFPTISGTTVVYRPEGCQNIVNPDFCSAQYTCIATGEVANCNCTMDVVTGFVQCRSNSVNTLCQAPMGQSDVPRTTGTCGILLLLAAAAAIALLQL